MPRWSYPLAMCVVLSLGCLLFMLFTPITPEPLSEPLSQMQGCKSNLQIIGKALKNYFDDHHGHFPKDLSQLVGVYLREIPRCPAAGRDTYSSAYRNCANPDCYALFCSGHSHERSKLGVNLPGYSSELGLITEAPHSSHSLVPCQAHLEKTAGLIKEFRAKHKRLPRNLTELSPPCPSPNLVYARLNARDFRISCPGLSHAQEGLQALEPSFDSRKGLVAPTPPPLATERPGPPPPLEHPPRRPSLEDNAPPLLLGIPAFIFMSFVLWPFESQSSSDGDNGWKILAPSRRKKE